MTLCGCIKLIPLRVFKTKISFKTPPKASRTIPIILATQKQDKATMEKGKIDKT